MRYLSILLTAVLFACGGGGTSGADAPKLTAIEGRVVDVPGLNTSVQIAAGRTGAVLAQGTADADGAFSVVVDRDDLPPSGDLFITTVSPKNGLSLRSAIPAQEVANAGDQYGSVATIVSDFSEAALLVAETRQPVSDSAFLADVLRLDEDGFPAPTTSGLVNAMAIFVRDIFYGSTAVDEYAYRLALFIDLIETTWPDVLAPNSNASVPLPSTGPLAGFNVTLKSSQGLNSASVGDRSVDLISGDAGLAEVQLSVDVQSLNGAAESVTLNLESIVAPSEQVANAVIVSGVAQTVEAGTMAIVTNATSFENDVSIQVNQLNPLPAGGATDAIQSYSVTTSMPVSDTAIVKWQVPQGTRASSLRLIHVEPLTEDITFTSPLTVDETDEFVAFSVPGFSLLHFWSGSEDSAYSLGAELNVDVLTGDPKGAFGYVKEIVDYLTDIDRIKIIVRSCNGLDSNPDVCTDYFLKLASRALASFMRVRAEQGAYEELSRYAVDYGWFTRERNALDEYRSLRAKIMTLPILLGYGIQPRVEASKIYGSSAAPALDPETYSDGVDNAFDYFYAATAYRLAHLGEPQIGDAFSELAEYIGTLNSYGDSRRELCDSASEIVDRRIVAEYLQAPKFPPNPAADFEAAYNAELAREFSEFATENYNSLQVSTGLDVTIEAVRLLSPIFGSIASVVNSVTTEVSAVNDALTRAQRILVRVLDAEKLEGQVRTNNQGCSNRCFGSTARTKWQENAAVNLPRYLISPEANSRIRNLIDWKDEFESCSFAGGARSRPRDVDGDSQREDAGFSGSGQPGQTTEPLRLQAKMSVSGQRSPGQTVTLDASSSTVSPSGTTLSYDWKVFGPNGSTAEPVSENSITTSFTPDRYGSYTVLLTVNASGVRAQSRFNFVIEEDIAGSDITGEPPRYILGSTQYGVSGNKGYSRTFQFEVDEDVTRIDAWLIRKDRRDNGAGIAIRRGSEPTIECFPLSSGSGEVCQWDRATYKADDTTQKTEFIKADNPRPGDRPGTYYLRVYGFNEFDSAAVFFEIKRDSDRDNDGVPNASDWAPDDPTEAYDSDGDGVGDHADAFPNDRAASVDTDGDGLPDQWNEGQDSSSTTTSLQIDPNAGAVNRLQLGGGIGQGSELLFASLGQSSDGFEIVFQPSHGVVVQRENTWVYTPDDSYQGGDTFTYRVVPSSGSAYDVVVIFDVDPSMFESGENVATPIPSPSATPTATPTPVSTSRGLLLKMDFEGNTDDAETFGLSATWNGSESYGPGPDADFGQAAEFDGGSYIRLTNASYNLGDFTLAMWLYYDGVPNDYKSAFALHTGEAGYINGGDQSIVVLHRPGSPDNVIDGRLNNSGQHHGTVRSSFAANTWTHVAVTRDADIGLIEIYINGKRLDDPARENRNLYPVGSMDFTGSIIEIGAPNFWGGGSGWDGNRREQAKWKGRIDSLQFYAGILTDAEIENLAGTTQTVAPSATPTPNPALAEQYENCDLLISESSVEISGVDPNGAPVRHSFDSGEVYTQVQTSQENSDSYLNYTKFADDHGHAGEFGVNGVFNQVGEYSWRESNDDVCYEYLETAQSSYRWPTESATISVTQVVNCQESPYYSNGDPPFYVELSYRCDAVDGGVSGIYRGLVYE